jgi:hypothetical protein
MAPETQDEAYEKPVVTDFGSLWDNTFTNPGGHSKGPGSHIDHHLEMAGNDGS